MLLTAIVEQKVSSRKLGDVELNSFPPAPRWILLRFVPDASGLLPGIWQMSLGTFLLPPASCHAKWRCLVFRCRRRVLMDAGQARMLSPRGTLLAASSTLASGAMMNS